MNKIAVAIQEKNSVGKPMFPEREQMRAQRGIRFASGGVEAVGFLQGGTASGATSMLIAGVIDDGPNKYDVYLQITARQFRQLASILDGVEQRFGSDLDSPNPAGPCRVKPADDTVIDPAFKKVVLQEWFNKEFRAALQDNQAVTEKAGHVLKVGVDNGGEPTGALAIAIGSFVKHVIESEG